jgi:hypothetical protein
MAGAACKARADGEAGSRGGLLRHCQFVGFHRLWVARCALEQLICEAVYVPHLTTFALRARGFAIPGNVQKIVGGECAGACEPGTEPRR